MQIKKKRAAVTVSAVNVPALKNAANTKLKDTPYWHLLVCLAEIADANATGHNAYSTVGCVKDFTALTLSVTMDGDRDTLYDNTLSGLAEQSSDWHEPL